MKLKKRFIRKEGGLEIKLSLFVSDEELAGASKIKEETYDLEKELRTKETDWFFTVLRILCYYVDLFNHAKSHTSTIVGNINRRKNRESKPRKKDRVRTKRKSDRKTPRR